MTNNTPKKNENKKGGINPAVAAATGAVIGAGIAAAGAYALRNEKNRAKVKKVLSDVKDQAMDYAHDLEETVQGEVGQRLPELKETASKALKSAKKTSKK